MIYAGATILGPRHHRQGRHHRRQRLAHARRAAGLQRHAGARARTRHATRPRCRRVRFSEVAPGSHILRPSSTLCRHLPADGFPDRRSSMTTAFNPASLLADRPGHRPCPRPRFGPRHAGRIRRLRMPVVPPGAVGAEDRAGPFRQRRALRVPPLSAARSASARGTRGRGRGGRRGAAQVLAVP